MCGVVCCVVWLSVMVCSGMMWLGMCSVMGLNLWCGVVWLGMMWLGMCSVCGVMSHHLCCR